MTQMLNVDTRKRSSVQSGFLMHGYFGPPAASSISFWYFPVMALRFSFCALVVKPCGSIRVAFSLFSRTLGGEKKKGFVGCKKKEGRRQKTHVLGCPFLFCDDEAVDDLDAG